MTVAIYAALSALIFTILSLRVIALRGNAAFGFLAAGLGDDEIFQRAVRAHANFAEYTPLILVLLFLLEKAGADPSAIHILGAALVLGRLLHGICFGFMRTSMPLRVVSTALTLTVLLVSSLWLLILAL